MSENPPLKNYCALVLGMHRSGTSAVSGFLVDMGFDLPSESLPPHAQDNPDGYFESREIVLLNNRILHALGSSWQGINPIGTDKFESSLMLEFAEEIQTCLTMALQRSQKIVIKDPRICRLLPLWLPILEARFEHLAILIIVRSPGAVFESLARRAGISGLSSAAITDKAHAYALWFRYNLDVLHHCRETSHHVISYEQWMKRSKKETQGIRQYLRKSLPGLTLKWPKPSLYSHRDQNPSSGSNITDTYQLLAERICKQNLNVGRSRLIAAAYPSFNLSVPATNQTEVEAPPVRASAAALLKHAAGQIQHDSKRGRMLANLFLPKKKRSPVIYVSQAPESKGHIYRVVNMIDALKRRGLDAFWLSPEAAVNSSLLKTAHTVIIHRCDRQPAILKLIDYCQAKKIPIGFDIDDYLFDQEIIDKKYLQFLTSLTIDEQQVWRRRISGYQKLIADVDFCIATTAPLKNQLERFNTNVVLVPNGFSVENLSLAKHWRDQYQHQQGNLRIGYASGTPTHDADFATIVEPIGNFLLENSGWSLTIIGCLSPQRYQHLIEPRQVKIRPLVAHINFAYELARLDILLVPLETGNPFCDAKSNLKWFEAALAGTPSICVSNQLFSDTINHGKDGLLCRTNNEWYHAMTRLSSDSMLRKTLADRAARTAEEQYSNDTCIENLLDFL